MGEGNKKEMVIPLGRNPQRAAELIQQAVEYLDLICSTQHMLQMFQTPTFHRNSTF